MNKNFIKTYADFLNRNLNPQKKMNVVFDCSNGTAGPILKELRIKNLEFRIINDKPDGNFPGHGPNPLEKNAMSDLRFAIRRHKSDLGIIFDADADRVFFIDDKKRFINPDAIARLLIWHLKPKKIIIDARTGWLVKKYQILNTKYQILISKVGHYFIKKLMRKINADFAAEYSGHYYFAPRNLGKGEFYFDSGILAAIEVINAVSKMPYKLSNFIDLLPQYRRSPEINFKIKNPDKFIKKIEKYFKTQNTKYKIQNTNYLDGLTMEFNPPAGGWWFNIRPSNTELLLRLNIEAENGKLLDKNIKKLYYLISKFK